MKYPQHPQASHSILKSTSLVLALGAAFAAHAAETELPSSIVTADRVARSADDTLVPVSVITRKDIERLQARSVDDLLRGLPGVSFSNTGGRGKQTSLFLRGTNSDHVLVLIDGIKIGSATSGTAALQDIPVDQIERIELVRGPRASLYGSEAIGGVLQIFTRKGGGKTTPSFSLGGGSHNTLFGTANLAGGSEQSWYNVGISGERTSGFNACYGTGGGCFANQPDKDAYDEQSFSLRGGYRFGASTSLELQALSGYSHNEFDGSFQNQGKTRLQVFGGTLRFAPTSMWNSELRLGQSRDDNTNYLNDSFASRFNTTRDSLSWQNDLSLAEGHLLTLGLDALRDKVDSDTAYTVSSRDNKALFGQYSASFGAADLQCALRGDDNEQFGQHTTGSLGAGYSFSPALRVTGSYGTAFKAPSFNQLYYPGYGNADLKPERARNLELGLSGQAGEFKWGANLFRMQINDLIGGYPLTNTAKARITGLELTASQRIQDTQLGAALTLQDPEDRSDGSSSYGKQLARRARQIGRIDLDQYFGRWSLGATLSGQGTRYDDAANKVKLGGYALFDLRGEYSFDAAWRLQARIENLFDKRYETAAYYNQPGFGAYLTLRYEPK